MLVENISHYVEIMFVENVSCYMAIGMSEMIIKRMYI